MLIREEEGGSKLILPKGGGHVTYLDLEKALEFVFNELDRRQSERNHSLCDELKRVISNENVSSVVELDRTLVRRIYTPLSLTLGAFSLLMAGLFVVFSAFPLSAVFLMSSAFAFLTYRKLSRR